MRKHLEALKRGWARYDDPHSDGEGRQAECVEVLFENAFAEADERDKAFHNAAAAFARLNRVATSTQDAVRDLYEVVAYFNRKDGE